VEAVCENKLASRVNESGIDTAYGALGLGSHTRVALDEKIASGRGGEMMQLGTCVCVVCVCE